MRYQKSIAFYIATFIFLYENRHDKILMEYPHHMHIGSPSAFLSMHAAQHAFCQDHPGSYDRSHSA